jgi:Protein of unknown function (DUF1203)
MDFEITGLPAAAFESYFALSDAELAMRGALRMVADRRPGFPCRVSLRDADPGETVLLLNFEHLSVATPYRSRHAIFVRQNAAEARLEVNEVPEVLLMRLLSVRAFSHDGMLLDADVMQGRELALAIDRMLNMTQVQYLHVHNAKAGCFAARVDRGQA